jgi:hypothetical protein
MPIALLSAAYSAARWVEYAAGAVAVAALGWFIWRVSGRRWIKMIRAAVVCVLAAGLCFGAHEFLGTRVVKIRVDSIKQVGLELKHAGLRTNALRYDTTVSLTASLNAPGVIGDVTRALIHKTTTVSTQVATYGLIDFTTVGGKVAKVDRQARTITLALPDPEIGKNTTYIAKVNGVSQQDGPLTAVVQGLAGVITSLFHGSVISVNTQPELAMAEARALAAARHSDALATCGKEEIVSQLTGIFRLSPAYRGYTVHVIWPVPPDPHINCKALQGKFIREGSP